MARSIEQPFIRAILAILLLLVSSAYADCECGYSVNSTNDARHATFTELWETDFLHLTSVQKSVGWTPQEYSVSAELARGSEGKVAHVSNVVANPLKNQGQWGGDSVRGGDPGLQLWVRSQLEEGMVPMAEIVGSRNDMLYGSFRAGIKFSSVSGTCGAWFWYRNDTQEIDMELLSRQFSPNNSTVNLVLQSTASEAAGFDASNTDGFQRPSLPFDPSSQYHEYRYDWLPDRVEFYIDGRLLRTMTRNLPSEPGTLMLNHWSNGNQGWSGGPPQKDAVMTLLYVKAYFNSTTTRRQFAKSCPTADNSKICQIPSQNSPPVLSGNNPPTYFFSTQSAKVSGQDSNNSTWNGSGQHNAATSSRTSMGKVGALAMVLACFALW